MDSRVRSLMEYTCENKLRIGELVRHKLIIIDFSLA